MTRSRRRPTTCGPTCFAVKAASTSSSRAFPKTGPSTSAPDVELGHVRQAERVLGVSRELAYPRLDLGAYPLRCSRDEADREYALDEALLVHRLDMLEERALAALEETALVEQRLQVALQATWRLTCERVDDLRECGLEWMPLVPRVPDQRETAPGTQHTVDLAQSLVSVEPVECLGDRDRVDIPVRERDPFCSSSERGDARHLRLQLRPHLADGLERDEVRAAREEQARELSGAGRQIQRRAPPAELEPGHDPGDRLGGVVGTAPLVDVGRSRETTRRRMQFRGPHRMKPCV